MKPGRATYLIAAAGIAFGLLAGLLLGLVIRNQHEKSVVPRSSSSQTVVIAGDISCPPGDAQTAFACHQEDTAKLIQQLQPTAVLTAGDNQYPSGALDSYRAAYDKTWGAFKDITYPTPGNHEYQTPDAAGYFDYFGTRAGERGKGYYSFSVGAWRFLALNSELAVSAGSPQLTWLEQELQHHPSACTLAYWHRPRFSSGAHPGDSAFDSLWRLLYDHNVDIIVNGHSHDYERFAPQNPDGRYDAGRGIVQFVSGMGGRGPEELRDPLPNLVTRQNHTFGVLRLKLYATAAQYEFVPIDSPQTFSDHGTIACH